MSLAEGVIRKIRRLRCGIYTPAEVCLLFADKISEKLFHSSMNLYSRSRAKRLLKSDGVSYHIKDVKLPVLDEENEHGLIVSVFDDTFCSYVFFGDRYDEATVDLCDTMLKEGLYGLVNDKINVTVESGDIVIDAGSWIGDFAAYASVKGAHVYAFEPEEKMFSYLQQTAGLNGNITPVKKGLSDKSGKAELFSDDSSRASSMMNENAVHKALSEIEITTIDDFVRENNLPRVDFIKSDIEGFERRMLAGAQETLARFAPKLALCTYHLPDDPQVMAELILKANPKYNIVQKRMKLFASVPE